MSHLVCEHTEDAAAQRVELEDGSKSRMLSLKTMPPQFSIAPPTLPGTAIRSSLGNGY